MVESMPNQTEFSRITSLADGCPFVACGNQGRATLWRNWVQPKRHSSMFKPVGFRNVLCPAGLVIVLLRAGSANPWPPCQDCHPMFLSSFLVCVCSAFCYDILTCLISDCNTHLFARPKSSQKFANCWSKRQWQCRMALQRHRASGTSYPRL